MKELERIRDEAEEILKWGGMVSYLKVDNQAEETHIAQSKYIIKLCTALEKAIEQRQYFLLRELKGVYIDEYIPTLLKKDYAYLDEILEKILKGEL